MHANKFDRKEICLERNMPGKKYAPKKVQRAL